MSAKTIGRTVGVLFLLAYVVILPAVPWPAPAQPAQSCWRMSPAISCRYRQEPC